MIKEKIQGLLAFLVSLRTYWSVPKKGRYMPYKEVTFYSIGAMGIVILTTYIEPMLITATNVLIGNVIGVKPMDMFAINVVIVLAGYPLTFLRAHIIDGSRSLKGKYRPYILTMAIPSVLFAIAMVWTPYEMMSYLMKCVLITFYGLGLSFFFGFVQEIRNNYITVLSPNSQERSDVTAINVLVGSFAPSIINLLIPVFAQSLLGINELLDIRVYRYIYPPFLILATGLTAFMYIFTKEKIIQAKTHIIKMKFIDALKAVAKNKYFWIISLSSWVGFLEGSAMNIMSWYQSYQSAVSPAIYGIIITIYGNASFWGMLFAPTCIRKYGKRNVLVATNFANIIFLGIMYPIVGGFEPQVAIWLVLICMFSNACAGAFYHVIGPSLQGDIRDYQHYITGERIDGMFSTVALIGSTIGLVTGGILPMIYDKAGLNETVATQLGYDNVYDVLYNYDYFVDIVRVLIIASVIGATLNLIPMFFYDLSETKQKGMISVLKLRALFEDYGNDALSDSGIVETIELINEASNFYGKPYLDVTKQVLKDDKKQAKLKFKQNKKSKIATKKELKKQYKADIKQAKLKIKLRKEFNEKVFVANMLMDELNKFSTASVQRDLERAKGIRKAGLENLHIFDASVLSKVKAMPKGTKEEKIARKETLEYVKSRINSAKAIKKHYPNGLVKFDKGIFDELFAKDDELALEVLNTQKELVAAKDAKNQTDIAAAKAKLDGLRNEQKVLKKVIKKNTNDYSIYNKCAYPYLEAKKLMIASENYKHYDEIEARYEAAKLATEEEHALALAKQQQKAEEKALKNEEKKSEKSAKKEQKKDDKSQRKDEKAQKKETKKEDKKNKKD